MSDRARWVGSRRFSQVWGAIGVPRLTLGLLAAFGPLGCDTASGDSGHPAGAGGTAGSGGVTSGGSANTGSVGGTPSSGGASTGGGGPGTGGLQGVEVSVNPYGNCPLVAVVNLPDVQPTAVREVQVVVAGQDGAPDFERSYSPAAPDFAALWDTSDVTFSQSGLHVPVLGLYADRASLARIVVHHLEGDSEEVTLNIETDLTSENEAVWAPTIQVETASLDLMEPGWTVAEINREPNPPPPIVLVDWTRLIAFDEHGAIRWALLPDLPPGETFTTTRSVSGSLWTGSFDTVVELTPLGRTIRSFQISGYSLHHEILQIGSDDPGHVSPGPPSQYGEHLLVLASKNGASTVQDHVLELDPTGGTIENIWDLATVLDPARTTYIDPEEWSPGIGDWLHANGLAYSNEDESIIVSGRHQGVAKVRRDGTLAWLLAPHEGWLAPQAEALLTAVDASLTPYEGAVQMGTEAAGDPAAPDFGWSFGQHSPALLPNGDLLLFDNGSSRHFGSICGSVSRAVIYRIDETAMTVRQMAQFVLSKAESSCFVSNTHLLPTTGNLFVQPGSAYFDTGSSTAVVKEVTSHFAPDGSIALDAVVFDAVLDLSAIQAGSFAYSYRGHRWTF